MTITDDRGPAEQVCSDGGRTSALSAGRALQVLDAFLDDDSLSLSELARRVELPKSTAFRLVTQLTESGYLERTGNRYRLSLHVFRLGNRQVHCRPHGLREIATPYLAGLFQHTGYIVNLAVLEGSDVVHLDKIQGPRAPRSPSVIGGRIPAGSTALGKALLAHSAPEIVHGVLVDGLVRLTRHSIVVPRLLLNQLAKVRESGVATDREECMLGLTCVAAPILGGALEPIAAISVSGPAGRLNPDSVASLVIRSASSIMNDLKRAQAISR